MKNIFERGLAENWDIDAIAYSEYKLLVYLPRGQNGQITPRFTERTRRYDRNRKVVGSFSRRTNRRLFRSVLHCYAISKLKPTAVSSSNRGTGPAPCRAASFCAVFRSRALFYGCGSSCARLSSGRGRKFSSFPDARRRGRFRSARRFSSLSSDRTLFRGFRLQETDTDGSCRGRPVVRSVR